MPYPPGFLKRPDSRDSVCRIYALLEIVPGMKQGMGIFIDAVRLMGKDEE